MFLFAAVLQIILSCSGGKTVKYGSDLDFSSHWWLRGKTICLDPGHGKGDTEDRFRTGLYGVTEEAVNLQVAKRLAPMLKQAGASVYLTRSGDYDVPLDTRCALVNSWKPDILVSIHHNGTIHAVDGVNYACVLVRGSKYSFPAGYDLAGYLRSEFAKIIDAPSIVISDHSVFQETGVRILRKTQDVCPGILGEGGFFTHSRQAYLMSMPAYNEKEAQAYFKAISAYFKGGIPKGELYFACSVSNGVITNQNPEIFLKANPGIKDGDIMPGSVIVTLDDMPISAVPYKKNVYRINYGHRLYPGVHRLRFQFRNTAGHSSMVLYSTFIARVSRGDFPYLIDEGRRQIRYGDPREGVKMLLSAYSMEPTGTQTAALARDIGDGFMKLGLTEAAAYYRHAVNLFHPDGGVAYRDEPVVWHPVKHYGKLVPIIYGRRP